MLTASVLYTLGCLDLSMGSLELYDFSHKISGGSQNHIQLASLYFSTLQVRHLQRLKEGVMLECAFDYQLDN